MTECWNAALRSIQTRMNPQIFDVWLRPIECTGVDGDHIRLRVPSRFFLDWITNHYLKLIVDELKVQEDQSWKVDFEVASHSNPLLPPAPPAVSPPGPAQATLPTFAPPPTAIHAVPPRPAATVVQSGLNPKYTFGSFVVGPSNQLGHGASMAVAEIPGKKYNPLFIYGGVGLGKTHLVNAIGHQILGRTPNTTILYLSAEKFMNEFIACLQNNRMDDFRQKYRVKCDVLLMDDIQFIAGKDQTQDEFFHTFNALYDSYKQIVITSDRYPQEIPEIQQRLVSRFQWGLVADIQAPELETRVAIVKKKAQVENIPLPDDVSFFLATHIKSNVRELEGTLIRLAAHASLSNREINIEFAKETLRAVIPLHTEKVSVEDVQRAVCQYYDVRPSDLKGPKRNRSISLPRQVAMFLCRIKLGVSFPEIGQRFGGKDHSTVISACRKIQLLADSDVAVRGAIEAITKKAGL